MSTSLAGGPPAARQPDPERVRAVFDAVADLSPHEREAYLAACDATESLVAHEVRELLGFDHGPDASRGAAAEPPATLGRFEVLGTLGQGGMGVVYAGRDPTLGRDVALKVVVEGGGRSQARLLREAQAMARLAHPNVVPIYEVGTYEHGVFLAMELVRGTTLAQWLRAEPRPWRTVLRTLLDAGRGLSAAHEAGVLHRDFKPDNVIVGEDGRARVLDFGLAREEHDMGDNRDVPSGSGLTRKGTLLGTPGFMSPEHFEGGLSPLSDQWSFAVTLYRALFGADPFPGGDLRGVRDAVLCGAPVMPVVGEVPAAVVLATARGMARYPEQRFPSLAAMIDVLDGVLRTDPDQDRGTARRQRRYLALFVASLALVNVLFVGLRSDFRFTIDAREAFFGSSLSIALVAVGTVLFRRRLWRTTHDRRVVYMLFLGLATISAHRLLAMQEGTPILMVLRTDALVAMAFYAVGAIMLERWFAAGSAIMAGYLALSFAFPRVAPVAFPLMLIGSLALGVWFWRDSSRGWGGFAQGTESTSRPGPREN